MRIRRTILAPVALAIGTVGAAALGPVLALTAVAPAAAATTAPAASAPSPQFVYYHG